MPAKSIAQRRLFAIAEHHPEMLEGGSNASMLKMSKSQMHDFATTPEKGMPEHVKKGYGVGKPKGK